MIVYLGTITGLAKKYVITQFSKEANLKIGYSIKEYLVYMNGR